ncbi:MAG: glycosyltransferase [Syntrophomonas sp.]|nr:glycosyltransferase [Syntrophomonas sp.]
MITPFHRSQRGNSQTISRLLLFLSSRGFIIELLSLEDDDWQEKAQRCWSRSNYAFIHGFNALHCAQVLEVIPEMRRIPLILTTTGTDINYELLGAQQAAVLGAMQAAQIIVVFHEDFRKSLSTNYPEFNDKLVTIPQGVFLETGSSIQRWELGLFPDDVVFLLPSGLRPVKNIILAIDALEQVFQIQPCLRLLIIGAAIDDAYSRTVLDRISGLDWVKYLGEIPHAQMRSIFLLGDVVMNTSRSEGQPQGALEAMSLGRPCILSAVPGNLNLISPGIEGFYIDSEKDLIAAAQALINDPPRRTAMGKSAQHLVKTRFSLEREIDEYSYLYNNMLSATDLKIQT